jgi:SAM-dependent methyltransferase
VGATTAQVSEQRALPPGLLVEASPERIVDAFEVLCALQPVRWTQEGLVCAPRAAPELASPAISRCPLPTRPLRAIPGWPDPPAAFVAGWYRRSPVHVPAPAGIRELVQAPGEGFGPGDHVTTAMCLEALPLMPAGPACDLGCGSGLLAQAWARLGRGPVIACDLDARALDQAARSLAAAGLGRRVTLRHAPAEALAPHELAGAILLANLPLSAQRALLARIDAPPAAIVLSGLRPPEAWPLLESWRWRGLSLRRAAVRGGFACLSLVSA